tara:strand:+ start:293 stop:538 length:246 start_codon:yes stop_codon:yes gene_type:complete
MIIVRCKQCGTELTSSSKVQFCGCPNQMRVVDDKVGAIDLDEVVMVKSVQQKKTNKLSAEDLAYQEARRQRKVRRLDFEER